MGDPSPTDCHRIDFDDSIELKGLPQHIQFHLETKLLLLDDELSNCSSDSRPRTLRIVQVTSLPSAQHEVYVVQLSPIDPNNERSSSVIDSKVSPATKIMTSNFVQSERTNLADEDESVPSESKGMINAVEDALWNGNYSVVVRIWVGSSRWWNCHHSAKEDISLQEVYGYNLAHHIFSKGVDQPSTKMRLPRVLYYSKNESSLHQRPWAILEYVGPLSRHFANADSDRSEGPSVVLDTTYIDSMIPVRMEYGYDEPHLRWGRLPVDRCIEYATNVLDSFIVPLHSHFYYNSATGDILEPRLKFAHRPNTMDKPISYQAMVQFYSAKYDEFIEPNIPNARSTPTHIGCKVPTPDMNKVPSTNYKHLLYEASQKVKEAIDTLTYESKNVYPIPKLTSVLCHLDLQPQNVLFATTTQRPTGTASVPFLVSVLDWEEAAYADPRFELLLLCRKVCANVEQANVIWHLYTQRMQNQYNATGPHPSIELGPIEPWLKLETVHSITTLLLECVAGGGRGKRAESNAPPAASVNGKIFGKMQREFRRLFRMGWSFCDTSHWNVVLSQAE
jgi:Phosphotransferase enzyme family